MGKIFCIVGKSASGKDTVQKKVLKIMDGLLKPVITCTTRPMREGEVDGREYFFRTEEDYLSLHRAGRIIEERVYETVYGPWRYFTADDGQIDLHKQSFLLIGTLESLSQMRSYYSKEEVLPIYIEADDGERLIRSIRREQEEDRPEYEEICRRFLADQKDFSEENLARAGISHRFLNEDPDRTADKVAAFIRQEIGEMG